MSETIQRRVAQEAIAVIKRYGWCQESMGSRDEGFCSLGAIGEAARRLTTSRDERIRWSRATVRAHPWNLRNTFAMTGGIIVRNDAPTTTKADVIAALEEIR